MNIPDAKASADKVCEKARNVDRMASDESEEPKKFHGREGRFTLLQCWAYVTSRTRIWSKSSKNTKGGVVLRGGVVVVDSGSCAVSRSEVRQHHTAAKVLDVIARLPGCAGQASDAVLAFTHRENGARSGIAETSEVWTSWYTLLRLPRHNCPKTWQSMEEPVLPLERNLCRHCGRDSSNGFYLEMPGRKHRPGNVSSCSVRVFSSPCTMRTEICSNDFQRSNLLCIRIRILSSRKLCLFFLICCAFGIHLHTMQLYIYTCVVASVHTCADVATDADTQQKEEREIERETTPPRHATARPIQTHITDRHTQTTHTADTSHFHSKCGCVLDDTGSSTDGVKFLTCQLSMVGSGPTTAVPGNREFVSRFWSGSQGNV